MDGAAQESVACTPAAVALQLATGSGTWSSDFVSPSPQPARA